MKKIILFLILAYSYSFSASTIEEALNRVGSYTCQNVFPAFGSVEVDFNQCNPTRSHSEAIVYGSGSDFQTGFQFRTYIQEYTDEYGSKRARCIRESSSTTYLYCSRSTTPNPNPSLCPPGNVFNSGFGLYTCNNSDGQYYKIPNPDPNSNDPICSEGFVKDGQYYNCNPNTNEAEPVPNSDGYEQDEDGKEYPKCKDGFEGSSTLNVVAGSTNYTSQSCVQVAPDTDGDGETENPTTPIPTITTGADGSKSWDAPDGNNYHLTPNGTLTTYYPDGSSSVKQVGGDYVPGSSGGGGGVSGGTSGGTGGTSGTGTDGNTQNELNPTPTPETPIDNTPVANSCNDSNLTLQEKLLCEMNAGVKKLNSESSPENSLNNLAKEINNDLNTNFTAVNKNIKDTNTLLTSSKALQENQLKELKDINTNLKNLKISGGTTGDTTTDTTETPLPTDTEGISDAYGADSKNFIDGLLGQYTTFKNNIDTQIDTLNNTFNNAKTTFENGVELNLTSTEIVNCPISYTLDMSSFFNKQIPIIIDFCEHTSKLKPLLYPVFLILMSLGVVFLAIRFIGVLI